MHVSQTLTDPSLSASQRHNSHQLPFGAHPESSAP